MTNTGFMERSVNISSLMEIQGTVIKQTHPLEVDDSIRNISQISRSTDVFRHTL
jgi:hypothetical protein